MKGAQAFHKSCSTIETNSTPIIAAIKSVTCPLALNDVSHEADSGLGFGGSDGSRFGGGWFFMLGYDRQGHRLVKYGCLRTYKQAVRGSNGPALHYDHHGDLLVPVHFVKSHDVRFHSVVSPTNRECIALGA